jgi:hypothetical protein
LKLRPNDKLTQMRRQVVLGVAKEATESTQVLAAMEVAKVEAMAVEQVPQPEVVAGRAKALQAPELEQTIIKNTGGL